LTNGAIMVIGSLLGIYISNNFIVKLGRPSIIIFLLGIVFIISALIVPVLEVMDIYANPSGLFKFKHFCPTPTPVNLLYGNSFMETY